jgi:hypothetical protein
VNKVIAQVEVALEKHQLRLDKDHQVQKATLKVRVDYLLQIGKSVDKCMRNKNLKA